MILLLNCWCSNMVLHVFERIIKTDWFVSIVIYFIANVVVSVNKKIVSFTARTRCGTRSCNASICPGKYFDKPIELYYNNGSGPSGRCEVASSGFFSIFI